MRSTATVLAILSALLAFTARNTPWAQSVQPATERITIAIVGTPRDGTMAGIRQGLAEANALGEFTGHAFVLRTGPLELGRSRGAQPAAPDTTGSGSPPIAALATACGEELLELAETLEAGSVSVLSLDCDDDAVRRACRSNLLHIGPSSSMREAALSQWRSAHREDAAAAMTTEALAWHPRFIKFSARELNRRFAAQQGRPMDEAGWIGWAAVKLLAESVVRTRSAEARRLLEYLREELAFDGVKGVPLSFRVTGQLRQPLLIVQGERLLGEAPVRGIAAYDELDTLGELTCGS